MLITGETGTGKEMAARALVVGARVSDTHAGWSRRLGNGLLNRLASYLAERQIPDLTSGFRAAIRRPPPGPGADRSRPAGNVNASPAKSPLPPGNEYSSL